LNCQYQAQKLSRHVVSGIDFASFYPLLIAFWIYFLFHSCISFFTNLKLLEIYIAHNNSFALLILVKWNCLLSLFQL